MREVYQMNITAASNPFDYNAVAPGDTLVWYHQHDGAVCTRFFMKVISVTMPRRTVFREPRANVTVEFLDGRRAEIFDENFDDYNFLSPRMRDIPKSIRGLGNRLNRGLIIDDPAYASDNKCGLVVYKATDVLYLRQHMEEEMVRREMEFAGDL